MTQELTALAETGAEEVVAAMATDLWQDTRGAVLRLFHRGEAPDRRAAIAAQLDNSSRRPRNPTTSGGPCSACRPWN
ncbi:hypothetical protein [Streptomyces reniochalinae]|uniref:hypothetical protein n=1 Tax=Streptomyces reniochalinae TaxID=2250578 RepID=UPI001FE41811|nr:hypothetical protein [Streptomyces reniochalinae]